MSAATLIRGTWAYAREVVDVLQLAMRRWHADDAASMAAAVAYYLALSLFPMLLLLTSGLGLFLGFTNIGQDAEGQILSIVAEHCSPSLETQVRAVIMQFEEQSVVTGPFGLLTAVLAAIGVFHQFERGFDKIWRVQSTSSSGMISAVRRILTQRLAAFVLLVSVGLVLAAILVANVAIGALRQWMSELHLPGTVLVVLVDVSATLILNSVAFGMLYRWLPKKPVRWRDAFRSGMLVAVVWEIGRQVLGAFLIGMRYATAYGAIGSFIALLLWFYWGVTILFFGAEYLLVLSRRRQRPFRMFDRASGDSSDASDPTDANRPRLVVRRAV